MATTAAQPEPKQLDVTKLNPALNIQVISNLSQLGDLDKFLSEEKVYGLDLETNVAAKHTERYIRAYQVGTRNRQVVVDLLGLCDNDPEYLKASQHGFEAKGGLKELTQCVEPHMLSRSSVKVGHSLRFEYEMLRWCLGVRLDSVWDTWIAEQMIYAGRMHPKSDFFNLAETVKRTCRLIIDKTQQTSFDLCSPLTDEQVTYAALDTRLVLPVRQAQAVTLEKMGMTFIAGVEMDALPCFGDMRINGMYLNPELLAENVADSNKAHKANLDKLDEIFVPLVGSKHQELPDLVALEKVWKDEVSNRELRAEKRAAHNEASKKITKHKKLFDKCDGQALINYSSGESMRKAFKEHFNIDMPDTDDSTLEKFSKHPQVALFREYRTTEKVVSTYGENFLKHVNSVTGRTHPTINQIGAATGRTSSDGYNAQNMPPELRACVTAQKPGWKIGTFDMAGAELRILTEISGEPSWVEAFAKDEDVHSMCSVMLKPKEWAEATLPDCKFEKSRKKCKCPIHLKIRGGLKEINFGIPYGMEEDALAQKMKVAKAEARAMLKEHRSVFSVTHGTLKKLALYGTTNFNAKTLGGRIRYFEKPTWEKAKEKAIQWAKDRGKDASQVTSKDVGRAFYVLMGNIERESKNTPIQGTNADIAKKAMGLMWRRLHEMGVMLINFVHDEFVFELPSDKQDELEALVKWAIKEAGTFFMKRVYMDSEGVFDVAWKKP